MKTSRIIFAVAMIACMAVIFFFSSQNATASSSVSTGVTEKLLSLSPAFRNMPQEKKTESVASVHSFIRKCAHFSLYALLGFCVFGFVNTHKLKFITSFFTALVFCVFYAVSDEVHQLFVPGRSCEVRDMCIDSCGALCGILLMLLFAALKRKKRRA